MVKFLSEKELEFIKDIYQCNNSEYSRLQKNIEDKLDQFFKDLHYLIPSELNMLEIKEKLFSIQQFLNQNLKIN